jgi:hypothetical protein
MVSMFVPVCFDSRPIAMRPEPSIACSFPKKSLESGVATEFSVFSEGREGGERVTNLQIKTADEFVALDLHGRWKTRRTARETDLSWRILRTFLERGGPIPVEEIVAAVGDRPTDATHRALVALDDDDLIRIRGGDIDIAYPFSASPTPFVVRSPDGRERYACCATDALGIAPMAGQRVEIRSRCHHCGTLIQFSATPEGAESAADGVMLWIGKRSDDRCRAVDSL